MASSIPRAELEPLRRKLLERQRALFDDVDGLEADLRAIEDDREAELETHGQGEALARLLDRVREHDRHELEEIYRALAKIPAGAYGVCEGCGQPIARERLGVIPEARYCLDCERGSETTVPAPAHRFEPRSHRVTPSEYLDLDDRELAEAVRERVRAHGDADLLGVALRCHGGVVRLSGAIPSEAQRQVLVQIIADGMGLEVLDRLRVAGLDREGIGEVHEAELEGPPPEERIPARQGMRPLTAEPWTPPADEGEPPEAPAEAPIPETE
jgi:RNA polymerase-binding transcription factor DksA